MRDVALVAAGGAVGSVLRYWVGLLITWLIPSPFPWGTLVINVAGSFVIGAFAGLVGSEGRYEGNDMLRLLVMVGLCGGFTTFSSFSLQTLTLLRSGDTLSALANILASVALCIIATYLGAIAFTRL
jgi:CrcB protein